MDNNEIIIQNLLQQPESNRLKIRIKDTLDNIAQLITAFINARGGNLILGIDENRKIVGVENIQHYALEIQNYLTQNICPFVPIAVQQVTYKNKYLLLISVWEGANKPYSYNLKIYHLKDEQPHVAGSPVISSLIADRKKADFAWERMPLFGAEMKDLDLQEIRKTIAADIQRYPHKKYNDEEDFLIQKGLLRNGNLTNACMVLFGKNPTRFIPQLKIRITVYQEKKPATSTFLENKWFESHIFNNITAIISYLEVLYGKTAGMEGLLWREKKNYPEIALAEGLLNAIIHHDYRYPKRFIQLSVYADRTEISNLGTLPEDIPLMDFKKEHSSILRNPDIASICFIRNYIETPGFGCLKILLDCRVNGFKTPKWKEEKNIITLIFPELIPSENEGISKGASEGVNKNICEGLIMSIEGVSEGVKMELIKIYAFIKSKYLVKTFEIEVFTHKSNATIERYLKILKDEKLIEFVGARKSGGYKILKKKDSKI